MAFLQDGRGAAVDWIALTAGIVLLGVVISLSVMGDSGGYLMDEVETLNERYAKDAVAVSELDRDTDINR